MVAAFSMVAVHRNAYDKQHDVWQKLALHYQEWVGLVQSFDKQEFVHEFVELALE